MEFVPGETRATVVPRPSGAAATTPGKLVSVGRTGRVLPGPALSVAPPHLYPTCTSTLRPIDACINTTQGAALWMKFFSSARVLTAGEAGAAGPHLPHQPPSQEAVHCVHTSHQIEHGDKNLPHFAARKAGRRSPQPSSKYLDDTRPMSPAHSSNLHRVPQSRIPNT